MNSYDESTAFSLQEKEAILVSFFREFKKSGPWKGIARESTAMG